MLGRSIKYSYRYILYYLPHICGRAGFITTLDGDNEWKKGMDFAGNCEIYSKIFIHQPGETNSCPSTTEDPKSKMITSSYQEIFGRNPSQAELDYWKQRISETGETYNQILEIHRDWKNRGGK